MRRKLAAVLLLGIFCTTHTLRADSPEKGVSLSVQIGQRTDDAGGMLPVEPEHVDQTTATVVKRLKAMGYSNVRIAAKTAKGFHVRIADTAPAKAPDIVAALQKTGKLELREVYPRSDESGSGDRTLARRVLDGEEIVPGYRAYLQTFKDEDDNETSRPILLNRRVALNSSDIKFAGLSPHQKDAVAITLNAKGTDKMIALTQNMRPGLDRIAIVLEGEVISAPVLNQVPLGRNFIIEGLREPGEVENLANALMNPLEFPILVEKLPNPPASE